jgi:hypothetical protein
VFCDKVGEDGASLVRKVVQVRIVEEVRGHQKNSFCVFVEKVGAMELDLELYSRKGGEVLLSCTFVVRRKMLRTFKSKMNIVEKKWYGLLLLNFNLRWTNTWNNQCIKKEAGFTYMIWN